MELPSPWDGERTHPSPCGGPWGCKGGVQVGVHPTWKKVLISLPLAVKVMRPVARSTRQPMTRSVWLTRACCVLLANSPPPHHVAVAPLDAGEGGKGELGWGGQPSPLPPQGTPSPVLNPFPITPWRCQFGDLSLGVLFLVDPPHRIPDVPPTPAPVVPVVHVALVITHGDGDSADAGEVEGGVVLVEVGGHPAHPDAGGLLPREDPHRVVVLGAERSGGAVRRGDRDGDEGQGCRDGDRDGYWGQGPREWGTGIQGWAARMETTGMGTGMQGWGTGMGDKDGGQGCRHRGRGWETGMEMGCRDGDHGDGDHRLPGWGQQDAEVGVRVPKGGTETPVQGFGGGPPTHLPWWCS